MGKTSEVLATEGFVPLKQAAETLGISLAWARQMVSKGLIASERSHLGRIFIHPDAMADYQKEQEVKDARVAERKAKGYVYTPAKIAGMRAFIRYVRADPGAPEGLLEYAQGVRDTFVAEWEARKAAKAAAAEAAEEAGEAPVDVPVVDEAPAPAAPAPVPTANVADLAAQVSEL